jgi:hypothetical protein
MVTVVVGLTLGMMLAPWTALAYVPQPLTSGPMRGSQAAQPSERTIQGQVSKIVAIRCGYGACEGELGLLTGGREETVRVTPWTEITKTAPYGSAQEVTLTELTIGDDVRIAGATGSSPVGASSDEAQDLSTFIARSGARSPWLGI